MGNLFERSRRCGSVPGNLLTLVGCGMFGALDCLDALRPTLQFVSRFAESRSASAAVEPDRLGDRWLAVSERPFLDSQCRFRIRAEGYRDRLPQARPCVVPTTRRCYEGAGLVGDQAHQGAPHAAVEDVALPM